MKKILAIVLAAVMLLSMTACGASTSAPETTAAAPAETAAAAAPAETEAAPAETYVVGICQLVQHDALDAATQGFKDALTEVLGDQVTFEEKNASGEPANCTTIVNGFVASKVDLIMANATPALQAAASATGEIPILGTSVTDYATALELDNWTGTVGGNISGTSDLAPLDQQAAMIQELFPDAKNVGLLYCSAEANSQYQVDEMVKYLADLGMTGTPFAFTDTNDVASVAQAACDASDVLYIPTDNTAASNTEAIANVVLPAKVPAVVGEAGICAGCGVATLSISYYDLGYATGKMAAKILTGEASISEMPVEYAPEVTKMYNVANCEALGVTIPDDYEPMEG
ncbi:MAG: ABC transporter substrate-binding protein [Faecousia sp.]